MKRCLGWGLILGLLFWLGLPAQTVSADENFGVLVEQQSDTHYQLILKNLTNKTYEDVGVETTIKTRGHRGQKVDWQVGDFGSAPTKVLNFTVDRNHQIYLAKGDASVKPNGGNPLVIVGIVGGGLAAVGLAILFFRKKRGGVGIVLLVLTTGAFAPTLNVRAAESESFTNHLRYRGVESLFTSKVTYKTTKDKLVNFSGHLSGASGKLIFVDQKTGAKQKATLADGEFQTRLQADRGYRVSGEKTTFTLKPTKTGFDAQNVRGATLTGSELKSKEAVTTLQHHVISLQKAQNGMQVSPKNQVVLIAGVQRDLRVGDTIYLPPFGLNFGGIAAKVTRVTVSDSQNQTKLNFVPEDVTKTVATVDASFDAKSMKKAVFIPNSDAGVKVKGMKQAVPNAHQVAFDLGAGIKETYSLGSPLTFEYSSKKKGYEIDASGSLDLKDSIAGSVKASLVKDTYLKAEINNRLETKSNEKLAVKVGQEADDDNPPTRMKKTLGTMALPVGGAISINLPVYLVLSMSGKASVELDTNMSVVDAASYDSRSSDPAHASHKADAKTTMAVGIEGSEEIGFGVKPTIALMQLDLVGFPTEAGFEADGEIKVKMSGAPELKLQNSSVEGKLIVKLFGRVGLEVPIADIFKEVNGKDALPKGEDFKATKPLAEISHKILDYDSERNKKKANEPKADKPSDYAKGFSRLTVPENMRGTWYGYGPYSDELMTLVLTKDTATQDGDKRPLFDTMVRTKEDQEARGKMFGGSPTGPVMTDAIRYRDAHWAAGMLQRMDGKQVLSLWPHWYNSDAGNNYYREGALLKNFEGDVFARTPKEAEANRPERK